MGSGADRHETPSSITHDLSPIVGSPRFTFVPMNREMAAEIVAWRYDAPYDFYDWDPADDPELMVVPESGSYGAGGQVPGCLSAGHYDEPALDVGLGLRPDLTGAGHGLPFVRAALTDGCNRFAPP